MELHQAPNRDLNETYTNRWIFYTRNVMVLKTSTFFIFSLFAASFASLVFEDELPPPNPYATRKRNSSQDEGPPPNPYHMRNKNTSRKDAQTSSSEFSCAPLKPVDCEELLQLGYTTSGVYNIWPRNKLFDGRVLQVYCDMKTDGGGWTVIQRRGDFLRPSDYFYKDWKSYKVGFGNIEEDFWLGNDNILALTNQRLYSARFDLTDLKGSYRYAIYDTFFIDNEDKKYNLTIRGYRGNANDSMASMHDGCSFSTKDQDNDGSNSTHCAMENKGGWWYNNCYYANLNGIYYHDKVINGTNGIIWWNWMWNAETGLNFLSNAEIKVRPQNFRRRLF